MYAFVFKMRLSSCNCKYIFFRRGSKIVVAMPKQGQNFSVAYPDYGGLSRCAGLSSDLQGTGYGRNKKVRTKELIG